jgi:hypothetical protein
VYRFGKDLTTVTAFHSIKNAFRRIFVVFFLNHHKNAACNKYSVAHDDSRLKFFAFLNPKNDVELLYSA